MRALFASALVVVSFAFAACGGGEKPPVTPAPETSATPAASSAAAPVESAAPTASAEASASAAPAASSAVAVPSAWSKDLSKEQKVAFMKAVVVPKMEKVFKDHDAKDFAEFGCGTCHGKPPKDPHEALPKLTMKGGKITAFADKDKKKAAEAKWMAEKVVPAMAEAMGQKPFDPKTKEGFGCMGCHTVDMADAPKADAKKDDKKAK